MHSIRPERYQEGVQISKGVHAVPIASRRQRYRGGLLGGCYASGRENRREEIAASIGTDIGTMIVRTPHIRGGRPHLAGTSVSVRRIAMWYQLGVRPEDIPGRIGHLTPA